MLPNRDTSLLACLLAILLAPAEEETKASVHTYSIFRLIFLGHGVSNSRAHSGGSTGVHPNSKMLRFQGLTTGNHFPIFHSLIHKK